MQKFKLLTLALLLGITAGFSSCAKLKKKKKTDDNLSLSTSDLEINGDSDSNKAGGLRTINFDFNSSALDDTGRDLLDAGAEFLKDNPNVKVQVEGHCDERGGVQYNLALGEKRARIVKKYLVSAGVTSDRVSTISFGKERPLAFGHDEGSWSRNRRANFVITDK